MWLITQLGRVGRAKMIGKERGKGKGEREEQWSNNCLKSEMPLPTTFI